MKPEHERWAEALAVLKMHSDGAEQFIADRIAALAGDPAGVARWQEIALRLAEIRASADRPQ